MFKSFSGNLSKSCSTHVFNNLIADFSKFDSDLEKNDRFDLPNDEENYYRKRKFEFPNTFKKSWIDNFCSDVDFEIIEYIVNVEDMNKVLPSFNHASCQCMFPNYRIDDYVNLSSYPLLEHMNVCLLYTSPSPRDATLSRMPSSA